VVTRYLTYTFGPISITFIQPFLDDTSRTQAVLSPKKSQLERGPRPRGGPGMLELRNVFWKLRSKKVWKVFWTPIIAKIIFGTFFKKNVAPPSHHLPTPPSHPFTFYWKIFAYQKIFWGGPERKFTIHPTRYRLARPGSNTLFVTGIFQNGTQTFTQSNYIS
jgi:hypothetical protein